MAPFPAPSGAVLHATDISFSRAATIVLDLVSVTVAPGDRIGLIGPNGIGKSTMLRVLAGEIQPDAGQVNVTPLGGTVGLLPQEPDVRPGETLREHLARRVGITSADDALTRATELLGTSDAGAVDRYDAALQHWMALGGADFESRCAQVCHDLGLDPKLLSLSTSALSGGQHARASLAAVLLSRHDLLLLDEPTNHLDLPAIEQLETALDAWEGTLILVTHDRSLRAHVDIDRTIALAAT